MAVAREAPLVAQRARERLPEHDSDVFDRVVCVDLEITNRLEFDVEQAMASNLGEHVLEEGQSGGRASRAPSVEIQGQPDPRFVGIADDGAGASVLMSQTADKNEAEVYVVGPGAVTDGGAGPGGRSEPAQQAAIRQEPLSECGPDPGRQPGGKGAAAA